MQRHIVPDGEIFARFALDRTSVNLRLPELAYLVLNLIALANHLVRYKLAETDKSTYVQSAAGATSFVPPAEQACIFMQYDVLLEQRMDTCGSDRVCAPSS